MAIKTKIVQINANTSLGLTPITGIGFQPNYMRVIRSSVNSTTDVANYRMHLGVATSPTEQWAMSTYSKDNIPNTESERAFSTSKVIYYAPAPSTQIPYVQADLVSFDADGATLNYTRAQAAYSFVVLFAEFPPEISLKAGVTTLPNTGGQFSETGLSFQPKFLELATVNSPTPDAVTGSLLFLNGVTDGTNTFSISNYETNGAAESDASRTHSDQYILQRALGTNSAVDLQVAFTSFNSDGFTLNNITPVGTAQPLPYLAIGGDVDVNVHSVTQTANGNQTVSGLGFQPELTMSTGVSLDSSSLNGGVGISNSALSMGFADDTQQNSIRAIARRGLATTDTYSRFSISALMNAYSADQNTTNGNASYLGSNADGYTLDWTNSDGSARLFYNVSFATASVPGVEVSVTEVLNSFIETSTANISYNVELTVNETLGAFTESSIVNIENVPTTIVVNESLSPFIEASTINVDLSVSAIVTETLNSFLEGSNVTIAKDIDVIVTENLNSFQESSAIQFPITITFNPKNTVRVKRQSNTVRVKRNSNIVRVK